LEEREEEVKSKGLGRIEMMEILMQTDRAASEGPYFAPKGLKNIEPFQSYRKNMRTSYLFSFVQENAGVLHTQAGRLIVS